MNPLAHYSPLLTPPSAQATRQLTAVRVYTPPTTMPRTPGRRGPPGPVGPVALLAAVPLLALSRDATAHGGNVAVEMDHSAFQQGMHMRDVAAQVSLIGCRVLGDAACVVLVLMKPRSPGGTSDKRLFRKKRRAAKSALKSVS